MQNKKAYIWNLVGKFFPQGIFLLTTIVLARYLSPADFGMISVLTVFFTVANVVMEAGLGGALIMEKEITKIDCSTMFVFNLSTSVVFYIVLFFSADVVADFYHIPNLSTVMRILCLIFLINAWGMVPRTLLVKNLKFKQITFMTSLASLIACVLAISSALIGLKVYALVIYQLTSALVIVIGSYYYSKYRVSFRFSYQRFKHLFSFGIMTTLVSVIDTIYENLMNILFGKYINVRQAGYLDQAKKLENTVTQSLSMTISNVAFPILSRLSTEKDKFRKEADSIFMTVIVFLFPLLMALSVYSKEIIVFLYGAKWETSAMYFSLLIFAGIFQVMETLNRNFIKSLGEVKSLFCVTLVKRALGIGLIFVCLTVSVDLILYAYIVSSFLGYFFNMLVYSKKVSQTVAKQLLIMIKALLPSVIIYIIISFTYNLDISLFIRISLCVLFLFIYYIFFMKKMQIGLEILKKNK